MGPKRLIGVGVGVGNVRSEPLVVLLQERVTKGVEIQEDVDETLFVQVGVKERRSSFFFRRTLRGSGGGVLTPG